MFDPYHRWLSIPPDQRPPTFYQLLSIAATEADPEVIQEAALRQVSHVRTHQMGPHAQECTRVLNEIGQACATLIDPVKERAEDSVKRLQTIRDDLNNILIQMDETMYVPWTERKRAAWTGDGPVRWPEK